VIYDRIGSVHRYGELKNMELLFEHLKGTFIKTALLASKSHPVALLLLFCFILEVLITYVLITYK